MPNQTFDQAVVVSDLVLTYRSETTEATVLHDINLSVESGTCVALVGESGSGKTTLGRAIAGRLPASASYQGRVSLGGKRVYMMQDAVSALNPLRRVEWQLKQAQTDGARRSKAATRQRSLELLADAGVPEPEELMRRYPHELSGGLAQRVLLATVLATKPRILVVDEPTSALDVTTQAKVMALFRELVDRDGLTIVLITHDIAAASMIADRIAVLLDGHLVEEGDTISVLERPRHAYAQALVAAATHEDPHDSKHWEEALQ